MKRPLKVLSILLLIAGIGLLVFGLSTLSNYFREKKLNEGFGTMTITSEELSAIRNAVLGGIEQTAKIQETGTRYYGEGWMDMRETAEYAEIMDLANNPDEYKSTYFKINGKIQFIQTGLSSCLLILSEPLDDNKRWSIDVMLPDDYVFSIGDKITVYGFFEDFYDVTNEGGKLETLPQIYTADIDTRSIDPVEK